jgi:hypothetical protein
MVSRVKVDCDLCGSPMDIPSEESVVLLLGYRSYATRSEYHRIDVCGDCLENRNVALELVGLERADREKAGMTA